MTQDSSTKAVGPQDQDAELLKRVGKARDRAAFTILFERHQRAFYNLAYRLTGRRDLAEKGVQDAACQIWNSAKNFRVEGNARGWMLRIVVRSSLASNRARKREVSLVEDQRTPCLQAATDSPERSAEKSELSEILGKAVDGLTALDRKIVSLYYGAGMSQQEVGEALTMPQTTISHRIQEILENLRADLRRAGFTAGLSMLEEGTLAEVILSGHPVPQGLLKGVFAHLDGLTGASSFSAFNGRQLAWGGGVTLVLVLALAVGISASRFGMGPEAPLEIGKTPEVKGREDSLTKKVPGSERRSWSFNSRADTGGLTYGGKNTWRWISDGGPDGSGCMETTSLRFSAVIDAAAENLPLKVTMHCKMMPPKMNKDGWGGWLLWTRHGGVADFYNISPINDFKTKIMPWKERSFIVTERFIYCRFGVSRHLYVISREKEAKLQFGIQGKMRIDNLSISPADSRDLPDVSKYLSALENIPLAQRTGMVALPDLPRSIPGQKVKIIFYPPERP